MATAPQSVASAGFENSGDAFLFLKTRRAGVIKGESQVPDHLDEIALRGWRWGVSASSAIGHSQRTSRRSYTALTVVKGIDLATTPLLSALATNDEVTEARLSMRRAGGEQELFFSIVLKQARISGVEHDVDSGGLTTETVTLNFVRVDVEYRPQNRTGLRGGSMTFSDDLSPE